MREEIVRRPHAESCVRDRRIQAPEVSCRLSVVWLPVCHEAESWDRADSRIVEPRDRVQLWFNLEVAKYLNLDTIQAHAEQRKNIGVGFEFIIPLCWIRIVSRLL
jgi:hypothetical protein